MSEEIIEMPEDKRNRDEYTPRDDTIANDMEDNLEKMRKRFSLPPPPPLDLPTMAGHHSTELQVLLEIRDELKYIASKLEDVNHYIRRNE